MLLRYITREILLSSLLVLAALVALFAFFDTIRELDDLGRGNYRLTAMLAYVTLTVPSHAYVLLPPAGLIGTLFGLARMSEHSGITVMRASGMSLAKLATHVGAAGGVAFRVGLAGGGPRARRAGVGRPRPRGGRRPSRCRRGCDPR